MKAPLFTIVVNNVACARGTASACYLCAHHNRLTRHVALDLGGAALALDPHVSIRLWAPDDGILPLLCMDGHSEAAGRLIATAQTPSQTGRSVAA